MTTGDGYEDVHNVEESETAKDEITPLVGSGDKSTDKTSDDHDLVNEKSDQDGGPWETGCQEQIEEKQWCCDEPVDVSNIEDLTGATAKTADLGVVANKLDQDGSLTKSGAHREVGNTCYQGDTGGDVVEKTICSRLGKRVSHESQGEETHDGADGEVPITTTDGDGDGLGPTDAIVDVESLISRHVDT